jgi:hypothetical protein
MDESRKRTVYAGILLGAVSVGLVVLARKTPRDQWGETLRRIATDAVGYVKSRYGDSEPLAIVEKTLEKYEEQGRETALSRAFHEAVEHAHEKPA